MNEEMVDSAQPETIPRERVLRVFKRALDYLKTVLVTVVVALALKACVVEPFRIPSASMEETLLVGDFLLVNKMAYGLRSPRHVPLTNIALPSFSLPLWSSVRRGDVVVFEFPEEDRSDGEERPVNYIKRCIGLPGDTVMMRNGRVFVNERELTPPPKAILGETNGISASHWGMHLVPPPGYINEDNFGPLVVPKEGDVLTLNRESYERWRRLIAHEGHTIQMAAKGTISIDDRLVENYVVGENYYFVLGDNRHNSMDSRFWGFVPDDKLIGEALMVYWSWDPELPVINAVEKMESIRWGRIGTLVR